VKRGTPPEWHQFNRALGNGQERPPINKAVLVYVASMQPGLPEAIAVGYRKDAAGDAGYPYFVVPGHGGEVMAWCDCLPVNDIPQLWAGARKIAVQGGT